MSNMNAMNFPGLPHIREFTPRSHRTHEEPLRVACPCHSPSIHYCIVDSVFQNLLVVLLVQYGLSTKSEKEYRRARYH